MSIDRIEPELLQDVATWRRHLHAHPELGFEVHDTAEFVAANLRMFGCDDVVTGIGRTGVVAVIQGRSDASGRVLGLRADMDGLPMREGTGLPYASTRAGCTPVDMTGTPPCSSARRGTSLGADGSTAPQS